VHQAAHFETTEFLTVVSHQRQDAATAHSAATLRKKFTDTTTQSKSFNIGRSAPQALGVVTRAGDVKYLARPINQIMGAQLVNQRERS
jgi:hypothetical protein